MPQPIDEDSWRGIIEALENLLPYYERTNIVNTWFLLPLWRRELSGTVAREDTVLEIGTWRARYSPQGAQGRLP
jgi:hypothetical protein